MFLTVLVLNYVTASEYWNFESGYRWMLYRFRKD